MSFQDRRCLFCEGEKGIWHDSAACAYELAEQREAWRQERFWLHIALAAATAEGQFSSGRWLPPKEEGASS